MARSLNEPGSVHSSAYDIPSRKLGMWAFIGTESLFFAALLVAYLIYRPVNLLRADAQVPSAFLHLGYTAVLTAVLITSSLTMVLALAAMRRGDTARARLCLLLTVVLGLCFLAGQAREFSGLVQQGVTLSSSLFGSTFFVLTGFHGAHVAVGVLWLSTVYWWLGSRPRGGAEPPADTEDVELVGLYWHFVDLVWVAIFTLVYVWAT